MNKAEKYKQMAADARNKSAAEIKYEALLDEIEKAAKLGTVAISQTKYTVEGLKYTRGMLGIAALDYQALYDEQEEIYDLLRKDGFDVRLSDPDLPSTLDINLSQQDREKIQRAKDCIEKDVLIIWDTEEFDK